MKYYAGIGSRQTPEEECRWLIDYASRLERLGYILRSGGANGADLACEDGVKDPKNKEIYLPWKGFNGSYSELYLESFTDSMYAEAYELAKTFYHSDLNKASHAVKKLMTRNTLQVFGQTPGLMKNASEFILCWTPAGLNDGGTGQALRIANHYGIKVYNIKNTIDKLEFDEFLKGLEDGQG